MQLVDGLQLEVLVVNLAEDAIHVCTSLSNHGYEGRVDGDELELGRIFNLDEAVVFVVFHDGLAKTVFEEGRVRKDQLTTFEFARVGRNQVLHEPEELFMNNFILVLAYVNLNRIDDWLDLVHGAAPLIILVRCRVSLAVEITLRLMHLVKLVAVLIIRRILLLVEDRVGGTLGNGVCPASPMIAGNSAAFFIAGGRHSQSFLPAVGLRVEP